MDDEIRVVGGQVGAAPAPRGDDEPAVAAQGGGRGNWIRRVPDSGSFSALLVEHAGFVESSALGVRAASRSGRAADAAAHIWGLGQVSWAYHPDEGNIVSQ